MSRYYAVVRSGQGDYLEHFFGFGSKKGSERKNHKYVARVKEGDSYRYFYSHAEYAAYQAKQAAGAVGGAAKTAAGAVGGAAKTAAGAVGNAAKTAAGAVGGAAKSVADKSGLSKLHEANSAMAEGIGYRVKRDIGAAKYAYEKRDEISKAVKKSKGIPSVKSLVKSVAPKNLKDIVAAAPILTNHQGASNSFKKAKDLYKDYHNNTPLGKIDKAIWNTTIGQITKKKMG